MAIFGPTEFYFGPLVHLVELSHVKKKKLVSTQKNVK